MCFCNEFRENIEKIKDNVRNTSCFKSTPSLDLYFTRTALNYISNKETGEKPIEKLFKKRGFQVISPEKLTIEEQISLLMKCKKLATTEGSCSHASVFCQSSAEVIILRKANYVNLYSSMIIDLVGYRAVFVDVHHSVMAGKNTPIINSLDSDVQRPMDTSVLGPFYLYVSKELSRYMGQRAFIVPLLFRPSYLNYRFSIKKKYYRLRRFLRPKSRLRAFKSFVHDYLRH